MQLTGSSMSSYDATVAQERMEGVQVSISSSTFNMTIDEAKAKEESGEIPHSLNDNEYYQNIYNFKPEPDSIYDENILVWYQDYMYNDEQDMIKYYKKMGDDYINFDSFYTDSKMLLDTRFENKIEYYGASDSKKPKYSLMLEYDNDSKDNHTTLYTDYDADNNPDDKLVYDYLGSLNEASYDVNDDGSFDFVYDYSDDETYTITDCSTGEVKTFYKKTGEEVDTRPWYKKIF